MKQFWDLFKLQIVALFLFAVLLIFLYLPGQNIEINLLPFRINAISWVIAWYYVVVFMLGCLFAYLRFANISSLRLKFKGILLKDIIVSDMMVALLGMPFLLFRGYRLLCLVFLLYSLLLSLIDWCCYHVKGQIRFMYVVLMLFLFVNVSLTFVCWQNNHNRMEMSAVLIDNCRFHNEWLEDDDNWTIAQYRDSELVRHVGPFEYPLFYEYDLSKMHDGLHGVFISQQYEHYVYSFGEDMYVLGTPSWQPFYRYLVNFTYLFVLSFCVSSVIYFFYSRHHLRRKSFSLRLQSTFIYFFIGTLLLVFIVASVIVVGRHERVAYYNQQYRMQFLVKYFTPLIEASTDCDSVVRAETLQMAKLLDADISFYNTEGEMFISEGKGQNHPKSIADFAENPFLNMPKSVYAKMAIEGGEPVVQSYSVLKNCDNQPIYMLMSSKSEFAKLKRNISLFSVIVFNLFFIVLGISILLSYFVSRKLSAPLSLLENKMSAIELGAENEKIDYPIDEDDVLSKLVEQYNLMIDKLDVSVDKLAKSEREASWRQMARQMAHEIKNPLTPMQLLTQRLLMQSGDNLQEYKEAVRTSAKALLQGIESITTTTEALSNFAKTPILPLEPINIVESVCYTVDLFRNNEENVNINFSSTLDKAMVMVDKEMVGHVFNNLLKNALQAIPKGRKGIITVKIYHNVTDVIISVTDNGVGIPEQNKDKLFNVNFTTKTKGMGLGLLVVKNVVDQAKGAIEFNSKEGVGTTFLVSFPLIKN